MITINFLPVAAIKRQIEGRSILLGYGLFLLLGAVAMFAVKTFVLDLSLERLAGEKNRLAASLNNTKEKVTEAAAVTRATITRWKQLAAIMELEERRRDQTRLLVEIEELLPKTNAWLVSLSHRGGLMSLEGLSTDQDTVSQFLTRLESATYIGRASVTLVQISQDLVINGVRLTKFSINARTNFPQPAILGSGMPEFGLPSQDDFARAVRAVDENLAADLTGPSDPDAPDDAI
jgi:Tfp pilus assembly protein PilN